MKSSFSFPESPHMSIFLRVFPNSLPTPVIRTKTLSALVPLQKNFQVKNFSLDAVHSTLPHRLSHRITLTRIACYLRL